MKTKLITKEAACPRCGGIVKETIYKQINVTENPELKDDVISGNLLFSRCPNCGLNRTNDNDGFIYVDEEKKLEIIFGSAATKESLSKAIKDRDSKGITAIGCPQYRDLCTNIVAIDDGLDWRVTQMALLLIENIFTKIKNDEDGSITFPNYSALTGEREEDGELTVLINYGKEEEKKFAWLSLPMEVYEHCYKEYKEILDYMNPIKFDKKDRDEFCEYYDFILERYNKRKGGKDNA